MENIPNFEEFETIEKTIFYLICTAISFTAYMVSIKGMYDLFPNVFRALGAFLAEIAVGVVLSLATTGILKATAAENAPILFVTVVVSAVIIIFARKVTLNYATSIPTSILQAVNSLVMHLFYILVIALSIVCMYLTIVYGSIDFSVFEKSA
jgi:hypothetical protein